ncbi:MAG TPA: HD domain-containing phosphohydrolase [Spirochaetota bacterium]|nr:HD domain-containing phosphohydrolase [Spirochaetota bacterium]HPI91057.1 HD domain-containing phosphohydrolase [Spirochaetota bacterium]HPR49964.1 HD domain-containing phosphohydrolase [Spirochaetota bacterium]
MLNRIYITEAAATHIEVPQQIPGGIVPIDSIRNAITSVLEGNENDVLLLIIFIRIDEINTTTEFLNTMSYDRMIFQLVVIGSDEELGKFNPERLENIAEFRTGFINRVNFDFIVRKTFRVLKEFYKVVTFRNDHLAKLIDIRRDQDDLINIGKALSSEKDPDNLLRLILFLSKKITGADAGSIYLVEEDEAGRQWLRFKYSHTFSREIPLEEFIMDLNTQSIAGYVAVTGEVLNIPDAYNIPEEAPYSFNSSFDRKNSYISRSMLVVPMRNHVDEIIGVIQLINSKEDINSKVSSGNEAFEIILNSNDDFNRFVVTFETKYDSLMEAIAGQAAVALENNRLIQQIQKQFEEFVKASVTAIESRDPATSGHSFRVADLCKEMAYAVNRVSDGYLGAYHFSESAVRELELAALLHDFGKVYIDLAIFQKSKKLFPKDFENLKLRFDFLYRCLELECVNREMERLRQDSDTHETRACFDDMLFERNEVLKNIRTIKDKIVRMNEPAVTDEDPEEILASMFRDIESIECRDIDGNAMRVISDCDRANLSIKRGSLNADERREIESHVVHTYNFVSRIPWPPEFKRIPEIALRHHEKLDGSGYPGGLSGRESISLQSRIMAIADIYDALSAKDRPYKKAVPLETTLNILRKEAEQGKLDPDLVDLFISCRIYERVSSSPE